MKFQIGALAAAAALVAFSGQAHATVFSLNLDGGGSNVGGSSAGNVRTYTKTVGLETLTVKASAWSNAIDLSPDKVVSAYLGAYSGNGLGVTTSGDGSGNQHAVDNIGRLDFIVLKFDQDVELNSGYFTAWDVNPSGSADSDATVYYKDGAFAPTNNMLSSTYFGQFLTPINLPGGSSNGSRLISNAGIYSDTWLVSAAVGSSDRDDAFKLKSISVTTAPAAVPEPATWAMMIGGFAAVGGALRRRTRSVAQFA